MKATDAYRYHWHIFAFNIFSVVGTFWFDPIHPVYLCGTKTTVTRAPKCTPDNTHVTGRGESLEQEMRI